MHSKEYLYGGWRQVTNFNYDYTAPFFDGIAFVESSYRQSFINKKGKVVIRHSSKRQLDEQSSCNRVLFNNGLSGFLDIKGSVVVKPKYEYAEVFRNDRAVVGNSDLKFGVIDLDGNEVVPIKYDYIDNFSDGVASIKVKEKIGYIDIHGRFVLEPQYIQGGQFREGYAKVRKLGRKYDCIINIYGDEIFSCRHYDVINGFSEKLAPVGINGLFGYIDTFGDLVIKIEYIRVNRFREGMALVQFKNNKYGFIDARGKIILKNIAKAHSFSEGLAAVRKMNMWGFIDKSGRFIVEPQFGEVSDVSEQHAAVANYGGMDYIKFI